MFQNRRNRSKSLHQIVFCEILRCCCFVKFEHTTPIRSIYIRRRTAVNSKKFFFLYIVTECLRKWAHVIKHKLYLCMRLMAGNVLPATCIDKYENLMKQVRAHLLLCARHSLHSRPRSLLKIVGIFTIFFFCVVLCCSALKLFWQFESHQSRSECSSWFRSRINCKFKMNLLARKGRKNPEKHILV